ncbi:MAG: hypothetical protein IIT89_02405 [Aeriscardovia sp.]|nr:hypothetical protein [Aeriscardovia sp.]
MVMLLSAAEMRPAEREAPCIPGVGKAPVVLMSTAVLPMSIDCEKLRLRSCRNTVLCPGAEFLQIHQFDGATPHQPAAQSPVAPLRFVEMLQRMVLPSDVALPCTWDSEDATTSAIDVLTDLDADGLIRPDKSARIPGLVLVSQVDAFRFLIMLQKSSLIGRVLGFAGAISVPPVSGFSSFPRSRRPAATPEDADELLHGVSPKRHGVRLCLLLWRRSGVRAANLRFRPTHLMLKKR